MCKFDENDIVVVVATNKCVYKWKHNTILQNHVSVCMWLLASAAATTAAVG